MKRAFLCLLLLLATPAVAAPPVNDAAMAVKALAAVCIDRQGYVDAMRAALAGWAQAPAGTPIHRKPTPVFSKAFGGVHVTLDVGDNGICAAEMIGAEQSTLRLATEAALAGRKLKYILAGDVNDDDRRVMMLHYARGGRLSEIVLIGSLRVLGPVTVNFLPLRPIDGVDADARLLR